MDQMDEDDFNAACWYSAEQDERARFEQELLTQDPAYRRFLQSFEEQS